MPPRIIVREATREQSFDLHQPSTTLGREPGCDIQLLDWKLSRRHARLDVTPEGVKVSDLGSTNGTLVNGRPITEALLHHGDEIQIGNVKIAFLNEQPVEAATQVLSAMPPLPGPAQERPTETGPVASAPRPSADLPVPPPMPLPEPVAAWSSPPPPPDASLDIVSPPAEAAEPKTVFLDAQKLQQLSQSAVPPPQIPPVTPAAKSEGTIRLPAMAEGPKTTFFDAQKMQQMSQHPSAMPTAARPAERSTQILGTPPGMGKDNTTYLMEGAVGGSMPSPTAAAAETPLFAAGLQQVQRQVVSKIRFPRMAWRTKFVLMLTLVLIFLVIVITVPLLTIQEKTTVNMSLERGKAFANALAARNSYAIINNQQLLLDSEFIKKEHGVKDAFLLDAQGRVLSPVSRSGEIVSQIEGISKNTTQIKIHEEGVTASGDYNMVIPIKNDNAQTVGLAWITYTPAGLSDSATNIALVIMLVIFLAVIGGVALVWGATNITVKPLMALQEATELVVRGDATQVDVLAGFAEVNALAHSINRLIEHGAVALPAPASGMGSPTVAMPGAPAYVPATPQASRPVITAATPVGGSEAGDLVVDGNFVIVEVKGHTAKWLGMRPDELVGKHVIEAVREQPLLEAILDIINALATQPQVTQEVDFSSVPSLGAPLILSATKSPGSDQTRIHLAKK